ncbi:MAG: hypothetical protein ACT4PP_15630, partial [Sporichthyaceae bacterium]
TGSFLALVGFMGALGAGLTLRLLPGRKLTSIALLTDPDSGAPPANRVVVRGTAAPGPGGIYRAPLSGRECVWSLATQTALVDGQRSSVDRFPAEPFTLRGEGGDLVLVGPACPGLDQIAPVFREVRNDPHPWFDAAPAVPAGAPHSIEVYEFVVTAGSDLLASGDRGPAHDGTPALTGELTLSAGGDVAAAGDPARRNLRRDLILAGAGAFLIGAGSLILGVVDSEDYIQDAPQQPGLVSPE